MFRTVLISLLIITLVGGLAGGGLFAWFSDTETSGGNTFTAGDINLVVNGQPIWQENNQFAESKPCQWVLYEDDLCTNGGTDPGDLWFRISLPKDIDPNTSGDQSPWQGGAYPDAEEEAEALVPGHIDNACDIQDYVEVVILYNSNTDYSSMLNGAGYGGVHAADITEAEARLLAHGGWGGSGAPGQMYKDLLRSIGGNGGMWCSLGTLHTTDAKHLQVYFHLKDRTNANIMQGDKVQFDKTFYLQQLDLNCNPGGPGGGKVQKLPYDPLQDIRWKCKASLVYSGSTNSYWTVTFTDIPGAGEGTPPLPAELLPFDVQEGVPYKAWCIDEQHSIYSGFVWDVVLVSSLDPSIYGYNPNWVGNLTDPWGYNEPNDQSHAFNYVNWLINNRASYGGHGETALQQAIWCFIDHHTPTLGSVSATAIQLYNDAIAYGRDFEPEHGQNAMVVMFQVAPAPSGYYDPTNHGKIQLVGFELDP